MPLIPCAICKCRIKIATEDWKSLLSTEMFLCSADCVFEWVKNQKQVLRLNRMEHVTSLSPGQLWSQFKSNFEKRFFEEAEHRKFVVEYEPWGFQVGKGLYTPDFYFPNNGCFVETKGQWGIGQKTKFKKFRSYFPDIKIAIVPWLIEEQFHGTTLELR